MIEVFYTSYPKPLPESMYAAYLELLPEEMREHNRKYLRWQDQHAHLLGKLLLVYALKNRGYDHHILKAITLSEYKRPQLNDGFDFNISHSGNYAVCALSWKGRIGIDIEQINEVDFKDYEQTMTPPQWAEVKADEQPYHRFFDYWCIKESLMKADGRGMYIPLDKLSWANDQSLLDGQVWHLKKLILDPGYATYLASDVEPIEVSVNQVDFNQNKVLG